MQGLHTRSTTHHAWARALPLTAAIALAVAAMLLPADASALTSNDTSQFSVIAGALVFSTAPDVPDLPQLTLNGQAQTSNGQMNNFGVNDATGTGSGWNITVNGNSAAGKSPVFAQYCPNATCGSDTGPGYVAGGRTLPADSLTLNSSGASFSAQGGSTGGAPTHQCNSGCFVDVPPASPTKVVSAATSAGMGTYVTTGFSSTSLALNTPSTLRALAANEVYRVDLVWSLNVGP